MRRGTEQRRGAIAILVAACLVVIFGVVAFAVDGGLLLDNKRKAQAAADAAALAAACDLFTQMQAGSNGNDSSGNAAASAKLTASADGFSNDGTTNTVTVHIPPTSGNFANQAG
jgi:Flp pilus assembly protein TadG